MAVSSFAIAEMPVHGRAREAARRYGQRLKAFREGLGLSQQDVATRLGLPLSTYRAREIGVTDVKADELPDLARALGVTPLELFNALGLVEVDDDPVRRARIAELLRSLDGLTPAEQDGMIRFWTTWAEQYPGRASRRED